MAELFSLLAAGIQVSQFMGETARTIRRFVKDGQSIPEDLDFFGKETKLFADVLIFFDQNTRILSERTGGFKQDKTDAVQMAIALSEAAEKGCRVLMERFDMDSNTKPSLFKTFRNQFIWTQRKAEVAFLRLNLANARSSVNSLTIQFALEYALFTRHSQDMIKTLCTQNTNARREARGARHEIRQYVRTHRQVMRPLLVEIYETTEETTKEIDKHRVRRKRVIKKETRYYEAPRSSDAMGTPSAAETTTALHQMPAARSTIWVHSPSQCDCGQLSRGKTRSTKAEPNEYSEPGQLRMIHLPSTHSAREQTRGARIRDNGSGIVEEEGSWPSQVEVDSTESLPTNLPTHAKSGDGTADEDMRPPPPPPPPKQDAKPGQDDGDIDSMGFEACSSHLDPSWHGSSLLAPSSDNESTPGPWRAAPPFGGPDGRRRPRRRRHRPSSGASD